MHAPAPAALDGRRGRQNLDPHQRRSLPIDAQLACGRPREIQNPVAHERPAIGDPHQRRFACLKVGYPHDGVQGQSAVGRGPSFLYQRFLRSRPCVSGTWPVPTGPAYLTEQHFGIWRHRQFPAWYGEGAGSGCRIASPGVGRGAGTVSLPVCGAGVGVARGNSGFSLLVGAARDQQHH